jgi:hypothetical protein
LSRQRVAASIWHGNEFVELLAEEPHQIVFHQMSDLGSILQSPFTERSYSRPLIAGPATPPE